MKFVMIVGILIVGILIRVIVISPYRIAFNTDVPPGCDSFYDIGQTVSANGPPNRILGCYVDSSNVLKCNRK
jgi:hypothetical protein